MARKTAQSRWGGALRAAMSMLFLVSLTAFAQQDEVNEIRSIKSAKGGVDIELHSTTPFPVRNELVRLHIEEDEFTKSRSPEDGSLNTLIFTLTAREFQTQVSTGDRVWVDFGEGSRRWDFGRLDKSLLDKKK